MKKPMILSCACVCATLFAANASDWTGTGLFTAETVNDFGTGTDAFPLGNGMIRYTGSSATLDRPVAIAAPDGRAATVRVTNPDATLAVSQPVTQTAGAFIKDGPGALNLTGAGTNVLGKDRATDSADARDLSWDETTGQTTTASGYGVFTLNEGRLTLGGAGQTNRITSAGWLGSRTQKSVRLDVVGGTFAQLGGNWFSISRGTA